MTRDITAGGYTLIGREWGRNSIPLRSGVWQRRGERQEYGQRLIIKKPEHPRDRRIHR